MVTSLPPPETVIIAEPAWIDPRRAGVASVSAHRSPIVELSDDVGRDFMVRLYETSSQSRAPQKVMTPWFQVMDKSSSVALIPTGNQMSTTVGYSGHYEFSMLTAPTSNGVNGQFGNSGHRLWFDVEGTPLSFGQTLCAQKGAMEDANGDHPMKAEMDEIAALQADWDGPGSIAPAIDAVCGARDFLRSLEPNQRLPDVSAGQDGEVNISWRDDRMYVDLSFYRAGGASMYAYVDDDVFKKPTGVLLINDLPGVVLARLSVS